VNIVEHCLRLPRRNAEDPAGFLHEPDTALAELARGNTDFDPHAQPVKPWQINAFLKQPDVDNGADLALPKPLNRGVAIACGHLRVHSLSWHATVAQILCEAYRVGD
jgi:hypothetical protein